jgi:hypothetical protein
MLSPHAAPKVHAGASPPPPPHPAAPHLALARRRAQQAAQRLGPRGLKGAERRAGPLAAPPRAPRRRVYDGGELPERRRGARGVGEHPRGRARGGRRRPRVPHAAPAWQRGKRRSALPNRLPRRGARGARAVRPLGGRGARRARRRARRGARRRAPRGRPAARRRRQIWRRHARRAARRRVDQRHGDAGVARVRLPARAPQRQQQHRRVARAGAPAAGREAPRHGVARGAQRRRRAEAPQRGQ